MALGSFIERLARAYMEGERQRLGIPQEERAAQEAADTSLIRRAQAAKLAQELGLAPAEQESQIALRKAQAAGLEEGRESSIALRKAQTDAASALAAQRRGAPAKTVERTVDLGDKVLTYFTDGSVSYEAKGAAPRAPADRGPDRVLVQRWTGKYDANHNPIMQWVRRSEMVGQESPAPPTVAQRNVDAGATAGQQALKIAQQRAAPVLQDLGSRILKLNEGREGGVMDQAAGLTRRAAGRLDSSADLYTTGIRGFVPLFARSVGHFGVLTELDVKRTEDLFPRIGDAQDVTVEKLARLQRIMTGQEPMPFQWEGPSYDERGITQPSGVAPAAPTVPTAPTGSAPQTRVLNGVTYVKVPGGWKRQ